MSKYKVGFYANSNANIYSTNAEVIDLVDDYGYTEKEAKEIINDEKKLKENYDTGYGYYRSRLSNSWNRRGSWRLEKDGSMIKYAEIYKQNIQGEIRYVAKMYVTKW